MEVRLVWLTALDLEVLPERLITCPFLESITLPELSTILVLGALELLRLTVELLLLKLALLPETSLLVDVAFLDDKALLLLEVVDLPERLAIDEVPVFTALPLTPERLPERLWVTLL